MQDRINVFEDKIREILSFYNTRLYNKMFYYGIIWKIKNILLYKLIPRNNILFMLPLKN